MQATSKAIPKFASFRPKPQLPSGTDDLNDGDRDERAHSGEHRHRASHKSSRSQGGRHRHRESQENDRKTISSLHESSRRSDQTQKPQKDEVYQTFVIDKRGDEDNVRYGYSNQYGVPLYYRIGFGNVLGLSNSLKIDRDNSTEKKFAVISKFQGAYRRRDKQIFAGIGSQKELRVKLAQTSSTLD